MDNDHPNTLRAVEASGPSSRPRVFDPALKHFARAFQLGEPESATFHERLEWERDRAEVRTHLLRLVAGSRWRDHLVLRGSVLMQSWFGERARDPKDIDWLFQPQSIQLGDPQCEACFAELSELARQNPATPNTQILATRIASDDIWTYERAAGRRLVFPFQSGQEVREVQMDIVWGEPLWEPPVLTNIPTRGGDITLWTATPALSLAWKLLWLVTDSYPQGKDLYDAVLLAESTALQFDLLQRVLHSDEWLAKHREVAPALFEDLTVDWENFALEFPWIQGDEKEWHGRLLRALAPTWRQ